MAGRNIQEIVLFESGKKGVSEESGRITSQSSKGNKPFHEGVRKGKYVKGT